MNPAFPRTPLPAGRFFLSLFALFIFLFGLSALATMRFLQRVTVVEVPDVTGKSLESARSQLRVRRLRLDISEFAFDQRLLPNHIISQEPAAKEQVKSGRTVRVKVSRGARGLNVPDVRGQNLRDAGLVLEKTGLHPGRISSMYHPSAPKQSIIDQNPAVSTWVNQGARVDLLVSLGPRPLRWVMPQLRGRALDAATADLRALGLEVRSIGHRISDDQPAGLIVDQDPPAGSLGGSGRGIRLIVASHSGDRASASRYLPITFRVPDTDSPVRIKIQVRDDTGLRVIHNAMERPNTDLSVPVTVSGARAYVTVFLNGKIAEESIR